LKHAYAGETYYSLYLHISSAVATGAVVERDDIIGTITDTGTFPVHLHFELRTKAIDPAHPWPNDIGDGKDGNAYYGDSYDAEGNLITGAEKRALDGIMEDPSGFIHDHRPRRMH